MLALNATRMLENIMRFTSVAIAAALTLVTVSTALHGQKRDDQIAARSTALLAKGEAAAKAGDLDSAEDTLETALAVDPRNRAAFVALGDVTHKRGMPGKAISSEERRVGKEWVSTCRNRGSPDHKKK